MKKQMLFLRRNFIKTGPRKKNDDIFFCWVWKLKLWCGMNEWMNEWWSQIVNDSNSEEGIVLVKIYIVAINKRMRKSWTLFGEKEKVSGVESHVFFHCLSSGAVGHYGEGFHYVVLSALSVQIVLTTLIEVVTSLLFSLLPSFLLSLKNTNSSLNLRKPPYITTSKRYSLSFIATSSFFVLNEKTQIGFCVLLSWV